jgi:hypothetical protein
VRRGRLERKAAKGESYRKAVRRARHEVDRLLATQDGRDDGGRCAYLVAATKTCSTLAMDQRLPWWWAYPTEGANGHRWGPGKVIVSWQPCLCAPARKERSRGPGHRVIECRTRGCGSAYYEPRHDPATARLVLLL